MKKLVLITLLLTTAVNTANAETLNDGHPKRGYNYKKHYRKKAIKSFFVRVFNIDNCHGKLNVH